MKNIKLVISYDGTDFFGWQATSSGPSIETSLQDVLSLILQEPIVLQAASRTDRGVHAEGQVVNFFTKKEHLECSKLQAGLNSLLPKSIRVLFVEEMALSFHPTLDAVGKQYVYDIFTGEVLSPKYRFHAWHVPDLINQDAMYQAAEILTGKHDFSSFCNARKNLQYVTKERTLFHLQIQPVCDNLLKILVYGDHFLYKMVRNLVGTLVYAGRGKISLTQIPLILESKWRPLAGMTAPAHGLTLEKIYYPQESSPAL